MKRIKLFLTAMIVAAGLSTGCSDFLERESQAILSDDQVFGDQNMIISVLSNFYGRCNQWGQQLENSDRYSVLEECTYSSGGPNQDNGFGNDMWRIYDYGFIRDLNKFLQGINSEAATGLASKDRDQYEGEVRFLRAWTYFNMARCMGGMPLIGDEVFGYESGMDITTLQYPRSTEAQIYDYVISECEAIKSKLSTSRQTNAARASKWAALALKARAAAYAGSIATFGSTTPDVKTAGGEVGIPTDKASAYYQTAYDACQEIINDPEHTHRLYTELMSTDKGQNFYAAVCDKNSYEVIWARDYHYPGNAHGFSNNMISTVCRGDIDANLHTPTLNIVEVFEYANSRDGSLKTRTADGSDYIYYDKPEDLFADKDARLWGTIVYPGADFAGTRVDYQAGQKYMEGGEWKERTAPVNEGTARDNDEDIITNENGPDKSDAQFVNNSGFNLRKFVDYMKDASTRGRGSDMWFVRLRYAEVLLIAAEASLELGKPQTEVCGYINQLRERGGIQPLSSVTIDDIIRERRVELAFENHRWFDARRFRIAHTFYNGDQSTPAGSAAWALFPYLVKDPTSPNNGKWVFDKLRSTWTEANPRRFELRNYYNFIDQGWINNNPKYVKNPYQ